MPTPAKPFLSQSSTLVALEKLVSGESLTIYCGAGVTRGHTGLTWRQLILEIGKGAVSLNNSMSSKNRLESLNMIYKAPDITPDQFASMVVENAQEDLALDDLGVEAFIANQLATALYKKNPWNRGVIVGNVTKLAMYTAMAGKPVQILTTNYDTHIEDSFDRFIRDWKEWAKGSVNHGEQLWPGLRWKSLGRNSSQRTIYRARGDASTVEIVYLHGRVAEDGRTSGDVVLTEADYGRTLDIVKNFTQKALRRQNDHLLIVGASITDPPLVRALTQTRKVHNYRLALQKLPTELRDLPPKTSTDNVGLLDSRARHLGVDMLHPDSYGQIGQFCEEAAICFFNNWGAPGTYSRKQSGVRYGQRLSSWWPKWNHGANSHISSDYRTMKDSLTKALTYLPNNQTSENFRLELWVRRKSDLQDRTITLWATSTGPIVDRRFLRQESLVTTAKNASVRALQDGKPVLLSISRDLALNDDSSRWKTYLSVPILIHVNPNNRLGGRVPVGVVTMASSAVYHKSSLRQLAEDNPHEMERLINYLIAAGRGILSIGG